MVKDDAIAEICFCNFELIIFKAIQWRNVPYSDCLIFVSCLMTRLITEDSLGGCIEKPRDCFFHQEFPKKLDLGASALENMLEHRRIAGGTVRQRQAKRHGEDNGKPVVSESPSGQFPLREKVSQKTSAQPIRGNPCVGNAC